MLGTAIDCSGESLICHEGHVAVPIWLSLVVIIGTLAVTVFLSLKMPPEEEHVPDVDHNPSTPA